MLLQNLGKLPKAPGVYLMENCQGEIVYVGRATSLKDRVRSYFRELTPHSPSYNKRGSGGVARLIEDAIHEVVRLDHIQTPSLLEAVILEANLIKKHQPRYNIKDKDNKSFLYAVITQEAFPKVRLLRGREITKSQIPSAKSQTNHKFQIQNSKQSKTNPALSDSAWINLKSEICLALARPDPC